MSMSGTPWTDVDWRAGRHGFFVTGTDTAVGKTALTAALCRALRGRGLSVGVFKPMASGAVWRDGRLVAEDAEVLAEAAGMDAESVCPVVYEAALAPGIAAAELGEAVDWRRVGRAWDRVRREHKVVLVEGAGGVEVPLGPEGSPRVWALMAAVGLPALVVARSGLGTLNHTTLTIERLHGANVEVAGIVMNDGPEVMADDVSVATNREWLERMTGVAVVARLGVSTCDPVWKDEAWAEMLGEYLDRVLLRQEA